MSTSTTALSNRRRASTAAKPIEFSRSESYLRTVSSALEHLPFAMIDQLADVLWDAYLANRAVFLFGNGGSAALASHCACDLGKGTVMPDQRRFRVLALTDNVPLMTAWANDAHYEHIFAEQLRSFIQKGDVAFAISGSGNSPNVLHGLRVASEMGALTVGLSGFAGGKMKGLCRVCVVVPSENMQVIEDAHLAVTHSLFTLLRARISEHYSQSLTAAADGACSA